MSKYSLRRLGALSCAFVLAGTLTSCGRNEKSAPAFMPTKDTGKQEFYLEKREYDAFKDIVEESAIRSFTAEEVENQIKQSSFYGKETKEFLLAFLESGQVDPVDFWDLANGERHLLQAMLAASNSVTSDYTVQSVIEPSFNLEETKFFDNREGALFYLPKCLVPFVERGTYGNFKVYEGEQCFVITDLKGNMIINTCDGLNEVVCENPYQLTSLAELLKSLGLESMIQDSYSELDFKRLRIAISQILNGANMQDSDIVVLDTTTKPDYLNGIDSYYFLEYVTDDAFSEGEAYYRDLLHPNAVVSLNPKYQEFFYEDLSVSTGPFYFHSFDFVPGAMVVKTLPQLIQEKGLHISEDTATYENLAFLNDTNVTRN